MLLQGFWSVFIPQLVQYHGVHHDIHGHSSVGLVEDCSAISCLDCGINGIWDGQAWLV
jgi:hypothetical protein